MHVSPLYKYLNFPYLPLWHLPNILWVNLEQGYFCFFVMFLFHSSTPSVRHSRDIWADLNEGLKPLSWVASKTTVTAESVQWIGSTCELMRISFQINIDFRTRESTAKKIKAPTPTCFDEAQKVIYTLMEKDSYPRFLKSNTYLNLLNDLQANSLKWLVPHWKDSQRREAQKECTRIVPRGTLWPFWMAHRPRGRTTGSERINTEVIQAPG